MSSEMKSVPGDGEQPGAGASSGGGASAPPPARSGDGAGARGPREDRRRGGRGGDRGDEGGDGPAGLNATAFKAEAAGTIDAEVEAAMNAGGEDAPAVGYGSMAMLDAFGHAPAGQPQKPKLRGPRVVEGGREYRTGTVVTVGPTDVFIEFGPKELGVIDRQQFKDHKTGEERGLPAPGEHISVVIQRFERNESLFICSLPNAVQKADWEMLQLGQVVEALVKSVNKGGLECEVAGHAAFLPASQVDLNRIPDLGVFVGEKLTCEVQRIDRRGKGNIVLSRREILARERESAAEALRSALKEGEAVEGTVRKIMPFGAFVDLGGVDGLIHMSDLSHDRVLPGEKHIEKHVKEGQKVRVQILKVDWENNRISLGLKQMQADPFQAAASEVVEGAELTGKVTKLLEFGCFVEVASGVEGLVHISEIDWKRIGKVSDAVQPGEVVKVKVLRIDAENRKISLSIKQCKEPPAPAPGAKPRENAGPTAEEIKKETPLMRRMREAAKRREFERQTDDVITDEEYYSLDDSAIEKLRRERKKIAEKDKAAPAAAKPAGGKVTQPGKGKGGVGGLGKLGGWDSGIGLGDLKL